MYILNLGDTIGVGAPSNPIIGDNIEEIKRLNEFKSALLTAIEQNSALRHLTNDTNYQSILHYVNEKHRKKLKDIDEQLAKYV